MNQVNKDNLTDLVEAVPQAQNNEPAKVADNAQEQTNGQTNQGQVQNVNSENAQGANPVPQGLADNQVIAQDGSVIDLGTTPPVIK